MLTEYKELKRLTQFNLIVGKKNTGKTKTLNEFRILYREPEFRSKATNGLEQREHITERIKNAKRVLLLDNADNYLNYAEYKVVTEEIINKCLERNLQLFLTSHNNHFLLELIKRYFSIANQKDNLAVYRFKEKDSIHRIYGELAYRITIMRGLNLT